MAALNVPSPERVHRLNRAMHFVLSLLVGLSDILIILCVPAVVAALLLGHRRGELSPSARIWRTAFRWGGRLGALLLVFCLVFLTRPGAASGPDRLDYGLLTGVPTLFVALVSAYSIAAVVGLAAFTLLPRTTGCTRPEVSS